MSSWQVSALLLSWRPKAVIIAGRAGPGGAGRDLTNFKSCIRSQPQTRARAKTKPLEASEVAVLTPGHLLSSASSREWGEGWGVKWKTLAATYKTVISKWYQKVLKHFKKL